MDWGFDSHQARQIFQKKTGPADGVKIERTCTLQ